jgi:ribonuclease P protein component
MSDEAHLPAEQSRAQAPSRLPRPHGDRRRTQGAGGPPQPRPQAPVGLTPTAIGKLTRRADYLAANGGLRLATPAFILLVRPRGDEDPAIRLGITVSKKVGGAVVRNRMKRRFRALAREILPSAGLAGADHVLVGRAGGIERAFAELRADLEKALIRLKRKALLPEPVEGRSLLPDQQTNKERASTGSARTDAGPT